jgi:hypothetical protein
MNTTNDPLWLKLKDFAFDPQDALTFTRRLARENNWSPDFSRRVVDEYRRFLFLALRAGHPVTPSDEIDQAWHLHLVYTRSYWEELCRDILGRPLHHGPNGAAPQKMIASSTSMPRPRPATSAGLATNHPPTSGRLRQFDLHLGRASHG